MNMRIVHGAVCIKCGNVPAYERWSVNRLLKTIQRYVLCGKHGKGLMRIRPRMLA